MTTQVQKLEARVCELERVMQLIVNKFEATIAKALDKVIIDGVEVETDNDKLGRLLKIEEGM